MRQIKKKLEPAHFKNWKNNFKTIHNREAVYSDLYETAEYYYLKKSLLEEQGYICCYCERKIGRSEGLKDCDIEHFMPRNPDGRYLTSAECAQCREAQMKYTNLFVSCKGEDAYSADHCNHKKDNWFDFEKCISPTDDRIKGMFGFKLNGKIFLKNPLGSEMEKHLNLSSYILEEQRKAALDTVLDLEFVDEDLFADKDYVETVAEDYDNMKNGEYTEFCSMITYCLREYYMPKFRGGCRP